MSSGKQRRAEIKKRRATRKAKAADKRPPKHLEGLARKKKKLF